MIPCTQGIHCQCLTPLSCRRLRSQLNHASVTWRAGPPKRLRNIFATDIPRYPSNKPHCTSMPMINLEEVQELM
ncbi:hypothetical protein Naga_100649g2 [Nannochloropsis gaditana]|uniref:Uncharacterized protein n=1 Tax=Nannochloropsis gaditana TaxID=72520 RepID=W7T1I7_9STRA|nr:hypothetical protein Naga_100649g2 [Nannochloropsis gaditana]